MQDAHGGDVAIAPNDLSDDDLERELTHAHEKRHDIFLTGTADQLLNLTTRTRELECEFLRRFPERVHEATAKSEDC
jgi:hypothetical protein